MKSLKNWSRLVILISLVGLTQMILIERQSKSLPSSSMAQRHDYRLIEFTTDTLSQNGDKLMSLSADSLIHNTNTQESNIVNPRVVFFENNTVSWKISAERGQASDDGLSLTLRGIVTLENPLDKLIVTTSELEIYPKKEYAQTESQTQIDQPGIHLSGRGFIANLANKQFELLHDVQGNYAPIQP